LATNRFIGGYTSSILISGIVHAIPFTLLTINHKPAPSVSTTPLFIEVEWQQPPAPSSHSFKSSTISTLKGSEIPPSGPPPKRQGEPQLSPSSSPPFTPREEAENLTFTNHKPLYPEEARLLGIEGTVIVRLTLCTAGKVQEAYALSPKAHPLLEQAALEQAKGWRFRISPSIHSITVPIKFELEE
jgi:protein TonB